MKSLSYLIRNCVAAHGHVVIKRLAAMGIRDHSSAPRLPRQNGHAGSLIGLIQTECLDLHRRVRRFPTCCESLPPMPSIHRTANTFPWTRIGLVIDRSSDLVSWLSTKPPSCATNTASRSIQQGHPAEEVESLVRWDEQHFARRDVLWQRTIGNVQSPQQPFSLPRRTARRQ